MVDQIGFFICSFVFAAGCRVGHKMCPTVSFYAGQFRVVLEPCVQVAGFSNVDRHPTISFLLHKHIVPRFFLHRRVCDFGRKPISVSFARCTWPVNRLSHDGLLSEEDVLDRLAGIGRMPVSSSPSRASSRVTRGHQISLRGARPDLHSPAFALMGAAMHRSHGTTVGCYPQSCNHNI